FLLPFFFCRHAALHPLHPFPTRRSSDLDLLRRAIGPPHAAALAGDDDRHLDGVERLLPLRRAGRELLLEALALGEVGEHADGAEDRKSTRLNSSHRTISYAVFCLKKKK